MRKKFDDIFSRLDSIHESDCQKTHGQTDRHWLAPSTRFIASRSKKTNVECTIIQ